MTINIDVLDAKESRKYRDPRDCSLEQYIAVTVNLNIGESSSRKSALEWVRNIGNTIRSQENISNLETNT